MAEVELPKPTEDDLLNWIREAAEMLERDDDYIVKAVDAGVFRQLWGICMQAIRHARAYVLLVDAGFEREAMVSAIGRRSSTRSSPNGHFIGTTAFSAWASR